MNLRTHALRIFSAALRAADPAEAVLRHRGLFEDAGRYRRIFVLGAGKASAAMAAGVESILGDRISSGLINVKYGHGAELRRIDINECGHPIPDANGLRGAERIAAIARAAGPQDLVICLISGGASALLPLPAPPLTLARKQEITELLLRKGADIHEMNTVRKHLSAIKGGQLAEKAQPAAVLSLILSDVVGDDLDVIGSGPTVADLTTCADAAAVLARFGIDAEPVRETPKQVTARNVIVGSNRLALQAAAEEARGLGYNTAILSAEIQGDTREAARLHAALAKSLRGPACLLSGGETTVVLQGNGKGGRNQEFALAAVEPLAGVPGVCLFSAGTDGTDGPTDAAGAVVDGNTRGLLDPAPYLANNDSHEYFNRTGGLIKTGPTGTNVMDVRVILAE